MCGNGYGGSLYKQMNNFISDIGGTHERCFVLNNMLKYVSF